MVCRRDKTTESSAVNAHTGWAQVEESLCWFSYSVGEKAAFSERMHGVHLSL